jgi:hypothetical protein
MSDAEINKLIKQHLKEDVIDLNADLITILPETETLFIDDRSK